MDSLPTIPLFPSGRMVATPGALALLDETNKSPLEFLSRHLRGDWGDLDQEDKTENELALKFGFRLLSSYQVTETEKLWVITEADRSVTAPLSMTHIPDRLWKGNEWLHQEWNSIFKRIVRVLFPDKDPEAALAEALQLGLARRR